jgi:hypothetical protein
MKMNKTETLTYGELHKKLRTYGYNDHYIKGNGKAAISFENKNFPGSRILLPIRDDNEMVESFYLNRVLMILRACGILEETNPLLS